MVIIFFNSITCLANEPKRALSLPTNISFCFLARALIEKGTFFANSSATKPHFQNNCRQKPCSARCKKFITNTNVTKLTEYTLVSEIIAATTRLNQTF